MQFHEMLSHFCLSSPTACLDLFQIHFNHMESYSLFTSENVTMKYRLTSLEI